MLKIPEPRQEKNNNGSGGDKLVPLLEERAHTRELLDLIESKRHEVDEEVYLRVKIDYELRLGNLNREIKRQARNFENTLGDYRDLVGRLDAADKLGVRALEELKVRYAVGEYSEGDYLRIAAGKKERIDFYRSKIKSYKVNMERLESVLAQLENG